MDAFMAVMMSVLVAGTTVRLHNALQRRLRLKPAIGGSA